MRKYLLSTAMLVCGTLFALPISQTKECSSPQSWDEVSQNWKVNQFDSNFMYSTTFLGTGSFAGTGTGAIPDRGTAGCGDPVGVALDVSFNVTGLTGAVTEVMVDITMTHTWMGDVTATLIAPDGTTSLVLFGRTGATSPTACGESANLGGTYNFTDTAAGSNWWAVSAPLANGDVMPAGSYRTTAIGPQAAANSSPETSLNTTFSALADANGTWILRFTDAGGGDTGSVSAANLHIETEEVVPTGCLTGTLFPSATFTPNCTGTAQNITTSGWAGEYSNVNLTAGIAYTFASSVATDYITVSDAAGTTVLVMGTTPVVYTPTTSGVHRFYTHLDAACGEEDVNRTRSIACSLPPCTTPTIATYPFNETFELASPSRQCWSNELVTGTLNWAYRAGAGGGGTVTTAHGGSLNASFYQNANNLFVTKLVSPIFDFTDYEDATLKFWYANEVWAGDQNELRVYYKTSAAGTWTLIPGAEYTTSVAAWTEVTLDLPESDDAAEYYIAFEGLNDFGRGVVVDDVMVEAVEAPDPGCLTGTQWPTATYTPLCVGVDEPIVTNGWAGEYSVVSVTSGTEYIFSSSVATDFITIGNETGTEVLGYGTGSVTWTSTVTGNVRFYTHLDEACGEEDVNRTRLIQCGEPYVVTEPDYDCFQGDGMASNGFEDGYNVTAGGNFRNADDFVVDAGTFNLQYIRMNLFMNAGATVTSATFNIRADEAGAPSEGTIIETITATPTSHNVVGFNFGLTISQVEFELSVPVDLSTGTYWLQPEITTSSGAAYWEVTSTGSTGSIVYSSEAGGAWTADPNGAQAVFFVAGACEVLPGGDDLLVVDLTVENQITITSTTELSAATVSGGTTTGFYFEGLLADAGVQVIGTTNYVGTPTLTAASVPTDNTPSIFRGDAGADPGLNIWGYSATSTTTFTSGSQAFTGDVTWSISPELYAALLTAPEGGNVYFPADDATDLATATMLGTYRVILPGVEPEDGCFVTGQFDQWPSATYIPSCSGVVEIITTAGWAGEFSKVQVTAGTEYIFSSSVATDFITIADEDEEITFATGTGSVTWTSPIDQVIRFYTHLNEDCEIEEVSRTRAVQCGDIPPPPANDDCEDAIALSCGDSDSGNTIGANDSGGNAAGDVFYTFTGTGTPEVVTVSLCGSSYDTFVRVFSDCTLANEVAFNDDFCDLQSEVSFISDGTSTYVIMVEGFNANAGDYVIDVSCSEVPPPPASCEDNEVLDNGLENGYFFTNSLAVDIPVGDEGYTVEGAYITVVGPATSIDFIFYDDNSGMPGTQVATASGTIIGSEVIGQNFGFDFIKYNVDFDAGVALDANTTYWMQVQSDATAWDWTSDMSAIIGQPGMLDDGTGWASAEGGEFVYQIYCTEMGVSDMNSFDFAYYPNPVKDFLNIESKKAVQSIDAFNLAGQKVMSDMKLTQGKLNLSNLSPGTYVFRTTLEGGQVETFKIIKK